MKKVFLFTLFSLGASMASAINAGLDGRDAVKPDGTVNSFANCNCGKQGASGTISAALDGQTMHVTDPASTVAAPVAPAKGHR